MSKNLFKVLAVLVVLSMLLAACGNNPTPTPVPATDTPTTDTCRGNDLRR